MLIVDDNHDAAITLEALLRGLGHRTLVARSGEEALEKVRGFAPDHIFLDIGMPGLDGYEVARRMRALPLLPQPRIMALTGWGQEDDRERSLAAGIDDHLVKPVSPDQLMTALGLEHHT